MERRAESERKSADRQHGVVRLHSSVALASEAPGGRLFNEPLIRARALIARDEFFLAERANYDDDGGGGERRGAFQ